MDFKMMNTMKQALLLPVLGLALAACTPSLSISPDENNIGEILGGVSSLIAPDGETNEVAIFDETTRKIHRFDLGTMSHKTALSVTNPGEKHYVIGDSQGRFVVDLTLKHLTIFDRDGRAQHDPIKLFGKPRSAAFRENLGLLVVYDDLMNVGIVKMSATGLVQSTWVGGPVIEGATIAAGDVDEAGRLVLMMSDGVIVIVNIDQTIAQDKWVFTKFDSGLTGVSWLAPLSGDNGRRVLVRSRSKVAILDLVSETNVSERDVSGETAVKLSKSGDPHVITQAGSSEITLVYAEGAVLKARKMFKQTPYLMNSHLDVNGDTWTSVETTYQPTIIWNDTDQYRESRALKKYRVSDLRALQYKPVVGKAQIRLAESYIFALFPSELGYAVRYNIMDDSARELRAFNLNYL